MDTLLFALRVAAALLLLAFMGAVFIMLWRDYRIMSREVDTRTRKRGRLVVLRADGTGLKAGAAFPLLPLTSLGRAPTNSVMLNDTFASGEHALVVLRGGQWWLEDRGSSNGTLLNGYRVEEPVVVSAGDVIAVGQVEFKLELE
ncbi:MAG: FHA domain-containing protein [Chloroflexota bacterium]